MFERFTQDARAVVKQAVEEARLLGSPGIQAEHLLLAISRDDYAPLVEAGLDHDGVLRALDAEEARSLAAVGVSIDDYELPPRPAKGRNPGFETSSKVALARATKLAVGRGEKKLVRGHILLGILEARAGTVPRALEVVGVDRTQLADRVAAAI
jgi:D-alanyl-D-alanine carboxypeptidase